MSTLKNYERRQGETWRVALQLEDSSKSPIAFADSNSNPNFYFGGIMTKGTESIKIKFKYSEVESRNTGRGSNVSSTNGIFQVWAYIPADDGTRLDGTIESTAEMGLGDWEYSIRIVDHLSDNTTTGNPSDLDNVRVILNGVLTIKEALQQGSKTDPAFAYTTPASPGGA